MEPNNLITNIEEIKTETTQTKPKRQNFENFSEDFKN